MIEGFACGFFAALGLAIIAIPIVLWVRLGRVVDKLDDLTALTEILAFGDEFDGGPGGEGAEPEEDNVVELPHAVGHSRH